jgi:hypothetical protein
MKIKVLVYKPDLQDETREIELEPSADVKRIVFYTITRLYKQEDLDGIEFPINGKTCFFTSSRVYGKE